MTRSFFRMLCGVPLAAALLAGGAAQAADSCREWRGEHRRFKTEVVRLYLTGAPQAELDAAVFELLQREAFLTSCDVSVEGARNELVGWRLVGRAPDEYGAAVVESVLERGGFDLELRRLFDSPSVGLATTDPDPRPAFTRRGTR